MFSIKSFLIILNNRICFSVKNYFLQSQSFHHLLFINLFVLKFAIISC